MQTTKEKLLSMELHEDIVISGHANVMRVPGGWIYRFFHEKEDRNEEPIFKSAVFVPNPNENFQ